MFVWREGGTLRLIQQTEHMRQVGEMGEAWGSDAVLSPAEDRRSLLCAAYEHDRGWEEWEARPTLDPGTHRPHDFDAVPVSRHIAFYRRGIDAVEAVDPYAGLLASLHGQGLYLGRFGVEGQPVPSDAQIGQFDPSVRAFIAGESARQRRLRAEVKPDDAVLWRQYALLQAWDRLSMFFCHGEPDKTLGPVPGPGGDTVIRARRLDVRRASLSPFPFPGKRREFPTRGYVLPDHDFHSEEELAAFLSRTPPEIIVFVAEAAS